MDYKLARYKPVQSHATDRDRIVTVANDVVKECVSVGLESHFLLIGFK